MDQRLLQPLVALALWTFGVWIWLYARRLPYLIRNRVPTDRVATPEGIGDTLPERVNRPSNNFRNLFELPVLLRFGVYVLSSLVLLAMLLRFALALS